MYIYISFFSYVFWFGDLNFRLDNSTFKSAEEIARSVNNVQSSLKTANILTDIWAQDELSSVMTQSIAFKGFFEVLPMFPPTYRYIVGSCRYDVKYDFYCKYSLKIYIFRFIITKRYY